MPKRKNLSAFTLIELLTVIAIIGVLASILIPVVGKMRKRAGTAETISNLKQLHGLFQLYAQENGNQWPAPNAGGVMWSKDELYPYMSGGVAADSWNDLKGTIFTSPNAPEVGDKDNSTAPTVLNPSNQGFGMNTHLSSFSDTPGNANYGQDRIPSVTKLRESPRTMLVMDCNAPIIFGQDFFLNQFTSFVSSRHDEQNAVLFCDGHVELISHERFRPGVSNRLLPFNAATGSAASLFWRGF